MNNLFICFLRVEWSGPQVIDHHARTSKISITVTQLDAGGPAHGLRTLGLRFVVNQGGNRDNQVQGDNPPLLIMHDPDHVLIIWIVLQSRNHNRKSWHGFRSNPTFFHFFFSFNPGHLPGFFFELKAFFWNQIIVFPRNGKNGPNVRAGQHNKLALKARFSMGCCHGCWPAASIDRELHAVFYQLPTNFYTK